ncbi:AI-2E family transporter [Enterococcus faecalis]|nr:AI-2E family transporter [Enterococcus faecalis]MDL4858284.1 AI-2E family transporter [Enterococcus faecalis]MDL4871029.1 AI-2E family transporter [Enterococcus faecalis]MDL4877239.1 AI-2E family transporter [Enterococcus faecalis]MDL4909412.1 AI-2E family transporter [Enterococcus faecalis]MDL4923115.1 AI-2E family transporter [Enterococcus faecalis]
MSLEDKGILKTAAIEKYLNSVLKDLSPERFLNQWTQALLSLGTLTKNVSSFFLNAFLTLIISIYALVFKQSILTFVEKAAHKLLSEKVYKQTQTWLNTTNKIFYKFISCQFLDACIIGVSSTILLSILNVKFAVTLGILLGICNMIPYFGSIFASIVAGVITLFTGGVTQAITVLLVLLILQQIDGNIIGPRIMGDALNVNPILIIVSITIGGAYFGVLGMFLAVPVAAIIKIIVSEWLNESKENDKIVDSIES